jgi:hypothetical protein
VHAATAQFLAAVMTATHGAIWVLASRWERPGRDARLRVRLQPPRLIGRGGDLAQVVPLLYPAFVVVAPGWGYDGWLNWSTGLDLLLQGIGLGLWWADSVAAAIISVDILYDGVENLRAVVTDLMDSRPTTVDDKVDPLPARVENELRKRTWVKDVRARLREEGHVYFGEIFVVPSTEQNLLGNVERAHGELHDMDWRLHDVVVTPTKSLEDQDEPNDEG